MRNLFYFSLLSSFLIAISCSNTESSINNEHDAKHKTADTVSNVNLNHPGVKVVRDFYTWYLTEDYFIPPQKLTLQRKKLKPGYYTLDTTTYFRNLDSLGVFSNKFIKNEKLKIQGCLEYLDTAYFEIEPEQGFDSDINYNCNFLLYDNWVGGQGEDFSGVNIIKTAVTRESIEVWLDFPVKVTVTQYSNGWLIDSIKIGD